MKSQDIRKSNSGFEKLGVLGACLLLLVSCAGLAAEKTTAAKETAKVTPPPSKSAETKPAAKAPASTPPEFEGCDSPTPMSRADRLAVLAKITLDTENELASEIESPPAAAPTVAVSPSDNAETGTDKAAAEARLEQRSQFRERVGTFAAGSMPDSVPLVTMDRSCWASFYGAQQKLAEGDEIGALNDAKEWKDCLTAMFPDRVALAQPYFSCFSSRSNKPKK